MQEKKIYVNLYTCVGLFHMLSDHDIFFVGCQINFIYFFYPCFALDYKSWGLVNRNRKSCIGDSSEKGEASSHHFIEIRQRGEDAS